LTGFGAEQQNGRIRDPFELGWNDPDAFPFTAGRLVCTFLNKSDQPRASGMTSFYSHGSDHSIALLQQGPTGQIENMEGASFFYISLVKKIPFQSVRAISNFVEPRDTSRWEIPLAVDNLNQHLIRHLESNDFNPDQIFDIGGNPA
jgi:futalosine hydrolase